MDFERAKNMTREQLREHLQSMTLLERLAFSHEVANRLGKEVAAAFPEAHARVEEGQLLSDRPSAEAAKSVLNRIARK